MLEKKKSSVFLLAALRAKKKVFFASGALRALPDFPLGTAPAVEESSCRRFLKAVNVLRFCQNRLSPSRENRFSITKISTAVRKVAMSAVKCL